jgi:anti-sigma-K factor RskA
MTQQVNQCDDHDRSRSHAELDWLAFAYVAGELTADEAADFELRLADDQRAREAVAAAIEIEEAVLLTEHAMRDSAQTEERHLLRQTRSLPKNVAWLQQAGWVVVGVAAALVLMAMVESVRVERNGDATVVGKASNSTQASALAVQWTELRERTADVLDEPSVGMLRADNGTPMSWPELAGGESPEELYSPDWLLAALAEGEADRLDVPTVIQE